MGRVSQSDETEKDSTRQLLALNMDGGRGWGAGWGAGRGGNCQYSLEARRGEQTGSPPRTSRRNAALQTCFRFLTSRTER